MPTELNDCICAEHIAYKKLKQKFPEATIPDSVWDFIRLYADESSKNQQTSSLGYLWITFVKEVTFAY